jgi:tetratricopeptide (TPR) repeat protein
MARAGGRSSRLRCSPAAAGGRPGDQHAQARRHTRPTLPAHELLGDLLLEQKRPAEALAAYQRSLALYPGRLNSLMGAARSARASGDAGQAASFYRQVLDLAGDGSRTSVGAEARAFLESTQ